MTEKTFRSVISVAKNELSKLEQLEKECEENHTEVFEINLLCIKLAAEKRADERDSILAKQLRLGNKAGQIVNLGLHNAGKVK